MKDNGLVLLSCWVARGNNVRIGLISDTHIPHHGPHPPRQVEQAFAGVDLILHAGDIYEPECLEWLERLAPVRAVEFGAGARYRMDDRVAEKQVIEICGYRVGMVHYLNLPGIRTDMAPGVIQKSPLSKGLFLPELEFFFAGNPVDVVVFGDTHDAMAEEVEGVLLVNPGSPSSTVHKRELGTVGILELGPQGKKARIINLVDYTQTNDGHPTHAHVRQD